MDCLVDPVFNKRILAMKNLLPLLVVFTCCQATNSQVTFQKRISLDSLNIVGSGFCLLPDGGYAVGGLTGQIVKLDSGGNLDWAVKIAPNAFGVYQLTASADGAIYILSSTNDTVGVNARQLVILLNANGEKQWDKKFGDSGFTYDAVHALSDGGVMTAQNIFSDGEFRYSKLSANGDLLWAKALVLDTLVSSRTDIAELAGGGYLIGGSFWNADPPGILMKIAANGHPVWGKTFSNFVISQVAEFSNGHLLVSGNSKSSNEIVFAKLTAQGDVIWAKVVANEGILVNGNVSVTPSDDIVFQAIFEGDLIGLVKCNENGQLEWARGYPGGNYLLGSPQGTPDGGYAFLIPSYVVDSASQAGLLKTDANGFIQGCESVALCPALKDFATQSAPLSWTEKAVTYDTAFETSVVPLNVVVEEYCAPLEFPSPAFQLPDSICAGTSVGPGGLAQANAGSWSWTFGGGSPGTSAQQDPGEVFFPDPGNFEIGQVISFGGCPDSFSVSLTVLPAPLHHLGPDTLLCEAGSYLLDGTSPGAISYLWENGSTNPLRTVAANGIYSLLVSNGFCDNKANVEVRFFNETFPNASPDLGPDSTRCENFTHTLDASVPGATSYRWEDGSTQPIRPISESGNYSVTVFFENCPLSENVEISLVNCEGKVYLPNAFSPNGDGFNDRWLPFGKDVLLKNLKIFDRWGGLLHDSDKPEAGWDGTSKDKPAGTGVYVFLLEYEHLITGRAAIASGEVHLVR